MPLFYCYRKICKRSPDIIRKDVSPSKYFFVEWAFQFYFNDFSLEEYRQYLDDHWEELVQLDKSLADDLSKRMLDGILREHVSGNPTYIENIVSPNLGFLDDIMQFGKNEIFVELGANNGDTFKSFIKVQAIALRGCLSPRIATNRFSCLFVTKRQKKEKL